MPENRKSGKPRMDYDEAKQVIKNSIDILDAGDKLSSNEYNEIIESITMLSRWRSSILKEIFDDNTEKAHYLTALFKSLRENAPNKLPSYFKALASTGTTELLENNQFYSDIFLYLKNNSENNIPNILTSEDFEDFDINSRSYIGKSVITGHDQRGDEQQTLMILNSMVDLSLTSDDSTPPLYQ